MASGMPGTSPRNLAAIRAGWGGVLQNLRRGIRAGDAGIDRRLISSLETGN
jgi:hypothetical protein